MEWLMNSLVILLVRDVTARRTIAENIPDIKCDFHPDPNHSICKFTTLSFSHFRFSVEMKWNRLHKLLNTLKNTGKRLINVSYCDSVGDKTHRQVCAQREYRWGSTVAGMRTERLLAIPSSFSLKRFISRMCICMHVCVCAYVGLYALCVCRCLWRPGEGMGCPGSPCSCWQLWAALLVSWELPLSPLSEQCILLTVGSSPLLHLTFLPCYQLDFHCHNNRSTPSYRSKIQNSLNNAPFWVQWDTTHEPFPKWSHETSECRHIKYR